LVREQFDTQGRAQILTLFAGMRIKVTYRNPGALEYGYRIVSVLVNGSALPDERINGCIAILPAKELNSLCGRAINTIDIILGH
jgi:hypothetical protein